MEHLPPPAHAKETIAPSQMEVPPGGGDDELDEGGWQDADEEGRRGFAEMLADDGAEVIADVRCVTSQN